MKTCPVCDTPFPDQHSHCPADGAVLIESRELEAGHVVRGKYRIVRKLGQGGMGVVYLAEHLMLGGNMALKFLAVELSRNPQFVKRFRNEARAAYQLRHPNIVEVTDLDQDEAGDLFIAMEYVAGPSLRTILTRLTEPLPVPRALQIAAGIASGLAAAHARGAVHRDIKPENILLATDACGNVQAKLLDFGIAALTDNITNLSQTRGLLLTPEYAAPEQWRGTPAAELDGRTDLYALGGILYEMLTGRTPFHAANVEGWMYQHLQGVPEPILTLRPELANEYPGLDQLVMSLLAKDRDQRIPSATAFLELLPQGLVSPNTMRASEGLPQQSAGAIPSAVLKASVATTPTASQVFPGVAAAPSMNTPSAVSTPIRTDPGGTITAAPTKRLGFNWGIVAIAFGGIVIVLLGAFVVMRAVSKKSGSANGASLSAVANPVFTPPSGKYDSTQTIAISDSTPNAEIHYTLDGSDPTTDSQVYTQPLATLASVTTIKAIAVAGGLEPSGVVTNVYIWRHDNQPPSQTTPNQPPPSQQAAGAFQQGKTSFDRKQYANARTQFSQACDSGNISACDYLGYLYAQGLGGAQDMDQARTLYQKGCAQSDLSSCASLGAIYRDAGDTASAKSYFKKACAGGLKEGCQLLQSVQ
jgi:serine/threonine protein kinase